MLELTSSDPQRLLTLPIKVIVVCHQVDVRHRDVVILGDWAGGKPGEPADGQLWLGRDGSKGELSLWEGRGAAYREVQDRPFKPLPSCTQVGRIGVGQQCLQLEVGRSRGKTPWT